jgi:iron complex outermembrane recepter protein
MTSRKHIALAMRQVLRTGVVAVVTAAGGMPAIAQEQAASAADVQEVVVTGSRIRGITNAESPSPVSVITSEEIAMTKASNLEDVLSKMTGVGMGTTLASNNGGGGASNVSLRDLGQSRTLILIDGQRLIPVFGVTSALPDLNAVPISMVERIEVLRDGASSIYGADAIGGVVNIITKKHAEGVTLDGAIGSPTDSGGGGTNRSLAGSIGVNSDKGNVMVAVSWDRLDPVAQAQRAWSIDPHQGAAFGAGGSNYRSQLNVLQDEFSNNIWIGGTQYSVKDPATSGLVPNTVYLTAPKNALKLNAGSPGWNYLTQGLDRKQISLNSHYDIAANTRFILEGFFSDRTSLGSLRPEPLLGDTIGTTAFAGFFVPDYAPGNTTGSTITAFLTPDQFGPRRYDDNSQTRRIRVGFEGAFGTSDFNWETGFVDQHNVTRNVTHHEGNFNHLAQITGQINCVDVPGGCSPASAAQLASSQFNLVSAGNGGTQNTLVTSVPTVMPNFFNGPDMFTPAQVAYLTWNNTDVNTSTERYSYASVNGPLFDLPAGPLRGAFGVEHRDEAANDNPDILVQEGFGPNQSGPTAGGYNVSSIYAEFNVPVFKNAPFAQNLTLSPSGRYDKYDTFGHASTWKLGLEWSPVETIRFRGAYSTGFRAPSVSELFAGQGISDITADGDPCDTRAAGFNGNSNVGLGVLTAGSTCSKAVAGGAAVTNFLSGNNNQTAQQQQVLQGGNPGLKPEKSSQYGIGFVLTPPVTPGLSLAVDYYNIRIDNTVLTGGVVNATSVDAVLNGCYGAAQNLAYCALITRAPSGTIIQINSLNANFGIARVTGLDYQLTYDTARAHLNLGVPGSFRFDLQLEQQYKNTQTNADGSVSSFVGFFQYENENINPRWKGLATVEYNVGPFTAHWDTRYIESMRNFDGGPANTYGNYTPNVYYHNVSGSFSFKDTAALKDARFVLGVNNLTNRIPPFLSADSICKCNTLAGPFDLIGRVAFMRVSTKF